MTCSVSRISGTVCQPIACDSPFEQLSRKGQGMRYQTIVVACVCVFLIAVGCDLDSWLRPATARAQEPVSVAVASRFQVLETKDHGDILVDTVKGRVFDFNSGGPKGGQILQERPVRACADPECTTWKRVGDATQ